MDSPIISLLVDLQDSEPRKMPILWPFVSNQIDVMSLKCRFFINTSELQCWTYLATDGVTRHEHRGNKHSSKAQDWTRLNLRL
jgi:hypothetical protein